MAVLYSAQYEDLHVDSPATRIDEDLAYGQLQLLRFSFTNPATGGLSAIGDLIYLRKVPPRCQIIVPACRFQFTAWDTNTTIDIGWLAYKSPAGATVAADDNGLLDGLDVDAVGEWQSGLLITAAAVARAAPVVEIYQVRAQEPVIITAVFRDAAPTASDQFNGWLAIAVV